MLIEQMPQGVRASGGDVRFVRIFDQSEGLILVAGPAHTARVKKPQIRIGSIQFERRGRTTDGFVEISELHERQSFAHPGANVHRSLIGAQSQRAIEAADGSLKSLCSRRPHGPTQRAGGAQDRGSASQRLARIPDVMREHQCEYPRSVSLQLGNDRLVRA